MAHWRLLGLKPRPCCIDGRATFTIEKSSAIRNSARHRSASIGPFRRSVADEAIQGRRSWTCGDLRSGDVFMFPLNMCADSKRTYFIGRSTLESRASIEPRPAGRPRRRERAPPTGGGGGGSRDLRVGLRPGRVALVHEPSEEVEEDCLVTPEDLEVAGVGRLHVLQGTG